MGTARRRGSGSIVPGLRLGHGPSGGDVLVLRSAGDRHPGDVRAGLASLRVMLAEGAELGAHVTTTLSQ